MAAENSLSDDELRSRLLSYGQKVGPVTSTTRGVYLKKLKALQSSRGRSAPLKLSFNRRHLGGFSSDESDPEEKESGWTSGSKITSKSPAYDPTPRVSGSFDQFSRAGSSRTNNLSYGAIPSRVADGEEFTRGRPSLDSTGLCRPSINGVGKNNYPSPMRNMSDSVSDFRMRGNNNSEFRASSDPYRSDFNFNSGSALGARTLRDEDFTPPSTGAVPRKSFSGRLFPDRDGANMTTDASYLSASFSPKTKNKDTHAVGRWQHVSMLLFALGMGFFVVLAYIYWDMTSSRMDPRNNFLLCPADDEDNFDTCVPQKSQSFVHDMIRQLIDLISTRAGSFECGYVDSRNVSLHEYNTLLQQKGQEYASMKPEMKTMILQLFVMNPHWSVRLYDSDDVMTSDPKRVSYLLSERSQRSLWCRFRMSATQVIGAIVTLAVIFAVAFFGYVSVRFFMKRKEEETKEVVALVERILDKVKQHADACQMHPDMKPYLAIAHVRDSLIPLQDRRRMQHVWDKAVQFIEAHESRVRTESQLIEAEGWRNL